MLCISVSAYASFFDGVYLRASRRNVHSGATVFRARHRRLAPSSHSRNIHDSGNPLPKSIVRR